jgi:hypothetical protein
MRDPNIAKLFYPVVPTTAELHFWLIFFDASFNVESPERNRAGVIILCAFGLSQISKFHVVDFCSHKLRRVARSTKTAETLAASEAYDRAFYMREVSHFMNCMTGILLVVDNPSLYADMSTTCAPKEKRLKVDLALLREGYENGDLCGVLWADSKWQMADSLTKHDSVSTQRLLAALADGFLRHPYDQCPLNYRHNFRT